MYIPPSDSFCVLAPYANHASMSVRHESSKSATNLKLRYFLHFWIWFLMEDLASGAAVTLRPAAFSLLWTVWMLYCPPPAAALHVNYIQVLSNTLLTGVWDFFCFQKIYMISKEKKGSNWFLFPKALNTGVLKTNQSAKSSCCYNNFLFKWTVSFRLLIISGC